MKRALTLTALAAALLATGPLVATDAEAFFVKRSGRTASVADSGNTLGLKADQLKIGTKRWYEQMEREGRLGGPRG
jgi:hypothetical protein